MLIDWFTVIAQAVNFLILVWLLKRFLYQPILHAIDAREQRIAAQLAEAAAQQAAAQQQRDDYRHKNEAFEQQRVALLNKTVEEAQAERRRLLEETRKESEALGVRLQETLRNEQLGLTREIANRAQQEVFAITRKVLSDLAAASLEESMAAVFMRRLRELNNEEKERLISFFKSSRDPAVVRSAFDLPQVLRDAIEKTLKESFAADSSTPLITGIHLKFETAPNLVSGIELVSNGNKVSWSIADYLASLEKGVGELLKEKHQPEFKSE